MRAILPVLTLLLFAALAAAQPGILDLERGRPTRIVVASTEEPPADEANSPMTAALRGVRAELRASEIAKLRACLEPGPVRRVGGPDVTERRAVLHLSDARGQSKRLELREAPDGLLILRELDVIDQDPGWTLLKGEPFRELSQAWWPFQGDLLAAPPTPPPAVVVALDPPYTPGAFTMDKETLQRRFSLRAPAAARNLAEERLHLRFPRGYDPRTPAGLLIWINAGPDGRPPDVLHAAADELGLICIGADRSGNDRPVAERLQLAFDALATASTRCHIDPRRVYVTGLSGGARVASRLVGCYPDVFTGAVPIVALDAYQNIPVGDGRYWRAGYGKPAPKLFRLLADRRIAAITGAKDGNHDSVLGAVREMKKDGLAVRAFDYPDMGHQMPTADRFLEAMRWVDEPFQKLREEQTQEAAALLDRAIARFGDGPATSREHRAQLIKVTEAGPWTEPAWRAAAMLGLAPSPPP